MARLQLPQWQASFGRRGLYARRPFLRQLAQFYNVCRRAILGGHLNAAGAESISRLAGACVQGLYALGLVETGDCEVQWVVRDLHGRMRLLAAVTGAFARRKRVWNLPEQGYIPVLIRGAEAARERLLAYDPAVMTQATSTDPIADLRLLVENILWYGGNEEQARPVMSAPARSENGGRGGIEGRAQGGMG